MKKLLLTILLVPVLANAQLQNYLTGSTPKTHRELQGSPTATTRLDTIIHSITIVLDSTISSLQRYGLNTGNYATIAAGLSDARSNRAPLIVPYDWTGGSPAPTTADSNVTIFDYRFGSFGFAGRRHWGFKSVFEADSLNRFRKILDSTRTWGRINLAEGTWSFDSLTISRPMFIQGTAYKRIKPNDVAYGGSIFKSTATTTTKNLLTINESGVHLSDLTLQGNSRLNGHGLLTTRQAVSGSINTTLGGYTLERISSFLHGGDGIHLRGADGVVLREPETFGNAGYGVAIVSPSYDNVTNAGNTAGGTTNLVFGGRTRANSRGGILIGNQAAPLLLGVEAIADTTVGIWLNEGRSRAWLLGVDSELQIPAKVANPRTVGVRVENYNGFYMGQSYVGTSHSFGSFTADAGTNTTTIVDAALINYGPDDYLVGSEVKNNTRSSDKIKITDYVASTGTITLASAITGQTTGDSYKLTKKVNVAVLVDSLKSGIFVNNNMAHSGDADTTFGVSGYGYATFVNNINFDPADNLKAIGGATAKWLNYNLSSVDSLSGGDARITSNTEIKVSSSDSIVINTTSTQGVELGSSGGGKVAIQPDGIADVTLFARKASDGSNKDLRIYYDANSGVGFTQSNIAIGGSSNASNTLSVENPDDVQKWAFGVPVRFSGADSSERQFEIQNMSNGERPAAPSSGFVKFYSRGDTAYVLDDNNVERSLYAGSALGDVVGPASSTDNAVVRFDGTTGKLVQNTSTTTLSDAGAFSFADGVTQTFNPNGTSAGLNVGSQAGDPSAPTNGDLWYDGTANELTARINGANVALGSGGGAPTSATYITQTADGTLSNEQALGSLATGVLASTTTTGVVASRTLTGTAGAVSITNGDGSANPTFTLPAAITVPTSYAIGSDPADAGVLRLENAAVIGWEASPAGTDVTLTVDASEILQASGAFNTGGAITEVGNSVPNATDHLGFFAATTSSQLAGVVSDETGTGAVVLGTSPTITTSLSQDGDVADTGYFRLQNAANIAWEASPAGTDVTLGVDASEILQASTTLNATALTEATNAVPNATDHLGFFAATTSTQLSTVLSDEVGTEGGFLRVEATGASAGNTIVRRASGVWVDSTITGGSGADTTKWYFQSRPNGGLTSIGDKLHVKFIGSGVYPVANGDTLNINVANLKAQALMFDDFCGGLATTGNIGTLGWSSSSSGTTITAGQTGYSTTSAPCWLEIQNNSGAANNRGQIFLASQQAMVVGGNMRFTARIKLAEVSAGTIFRFGFYDLTTSAVSYPTDGLFAEVNIDSSANWRLVSSNGSTRTFKNSATAASTSVTTIDIVTNSGYTQADLYINGVLTTASITTNLPGSTAEGTVHFVEQTKDTSTRTVGIDFFSYALVGISR